MYNSSVMNTLMVVDITIAVAMYAAITASQWFIFRKAGEKPWKALIPFYALYTLHKLVWETATFWISMALLFGGLIPELLFGDHIAVVIITTVLEIIALALEVIESVKVAHSFGKSTKFGIASFFLPFVFLPIIAFGNAEYIGPEGKPAEEHKKNKTKTE